MSSFRFTDGTPYEGVPRMWAWPCGCGRVDMSSSAVYQKAKALLDASELEECHRLLSQLIDDQRALQERPEAEQNGGEILQ